MYLKEIQTIGFKSFADKLNFEFTNNINGIVGPNGSGKSNVVDAIRWVLGEQSNKQLRADTSTSVIFSGSTSRKALNSAMVNLIFDNSDKHLPIDFNEVSVKRIMYRTGENEYYLNGEKCRLKDISDLLTDSGAAKESFNIIGQGKIDEILSVKPLDRRVIFEEAAGVLKYKKRKEEALRKLERTNNNLNRINDIISELETNLRPLEEESIAAKKYNEAKENLTNKEISLLIHDIDTYNFEFNKNKEKITSLTDEISKLNTTNSTYDVNILELKNKLNSTEEKISNINKSIIEKTKLMDTTDADIRILRERKKYLDNDTEKDTTHLLENKLSKESELSSIISSKDLEEKNISILEESINVEKNKLENILKDITKLENLVNKNNIILADTSYKINSLEDKINNGGGIPTSVKSILNNPKFTGVNNTIGALLEVPSEYSLAVSTSLAATSNYLVVDTKSIANRLVNYLKENRLGRATFYPLDVIKGRYIESNLLDEIKKEHGFIDALINKVEYDTKYQNIMLNVLGNVILADNIENASNISKLVNHKYKVVTLDGQVVNIGGSITGGEQIKTTDTIRLKYELEELKNTFEELNYENNSYLDKINTYRETKNDIEKKLNLLEIDKYNKNSLIKEKDNLINSIKSDLTNLESELNDLLAINSKETDEHESELLNKYYHTKDEINNLEKELSILKIEKDKINNDILEIESMSKNDMIHINGLEKELKDLELRSSKLEVRIDTALNSLNEDYTITYNEAKEKYILEGNPEDYRKVVQNLKNIIKDIGIVNLGAISEYERVKERYDFLTKQKEDLFKAEDTLLEIIHDMDDIMKEKFITTFNEIKDEFKKVFKELFKGGNANIYLTEPDNILETGIELEATPPGKNLKNLESLSGGERTFTAISLLFAILNVRPVPFCVLDEVEAALDEANVDAFGEYLNKYRDKTQFLLITHKKKTMEYIDTLYGITMQESGVSKLVSVKLDNIK